MPVDEDKEVDKQMKRGLEGGRRIHHSWAAHLHLLFIKDADTLVVEEDKEVNNEVAGGLDVLGW